MGGIIFSPVGLCEPSWASLVKERKPTHFENTNEPGGLWVRMLLLKNWNCFWIENSNIRNLDPKKDK